MLFFLILYSVLGEYMLRKIVLFVSTLMMFGCVTMTFDWVPQSVAILPLGNQTADVAVDDFARYHLYERLEKIADYDLMPLEEVDRALDDLGITDAGQLPTISIEELAEKLGVEAIITGDVIVADRVMLGVYFKKEFEATYSMIKTSDETVVWSENYYSKDSKLVLNPAQVVTGMVEEMAKEITSDLVAKMFKSHPLYEQIVDVNVASTKSIPR